MAALCALPAPAFAHSQLSSANPAPNSVVTTAVSEVVLTFNSPVILFGDGITVSSATQTVKTAPTIAGSTVTAKLATPIGAGSYDVTWNIEAADGHRTTASYSFSVAAGVVAPVTAPGTLPEPTTTTTTTTVPGASTTAPRTTETELTAPPDQPGRSDGTKSVPNWALYAIAAIVIVGLAAAIGSIVRLIRKRRG